MLFNTHKKSKGFTLVEIIVAMVALAISMSVILSLIVPAEQQSADQLHQIKAAELGQSMLDEILGRAFDDNSDMVGGHWRCDEEGRPACTDEGDFGPDLDELTTDRNSFDDVDDYHGFEEQVNATNDTLDSGYDSFSIAIDVQYKGLELNLANNKLAKRITVTITTPLGSAISFSAYKSNF